MSKLFNKVLPFVFKEYLKSVVFVSKTEKISREKRTKFYSEFINHGSLVYDVGANIGNRTFTFLKLGANVVAIEPQRKCRRILKLRFGNKIKVVPLGLGEKEDIKKFYISSSHTLSTFSEAWIKEMSESNRFSNAIWNKHKQFNITTLDNLINKYGEPKFIKIDVEGYEFEVLKGLNRIIEFVSFEYAVPENAMALKECICRLNSLNKNYLFNYSIGETMALHSERWYTYHEMTTFITTHEFLLTGVGDIYVKAQH